MRRTRARTLVVRPAPFLDAGGDTARIMRDVLLALVPVLIAAVFFFGPAALLIVGMATLGAVGTEWVLSGSRRKQVLRDYSGLLTGVLIGLTLPPGVPLWMAFLGGVAGMGLGKVVWGGLGQNPFNPALVGRAFLQAAFPVAMTTWPAPREHWWDLPSTVAAMPMMHPVVDGVSGATPLGMFKFEHQATAVQDVMLGSISGSLGETSAVLILLCGAFLVFRRAFDWRIPVAIVIAVLAGASGLHLWDPAVFASPWFMLGSGGLLFGAIFMATDPVTSPTTPLGSVIFGLGIGAIVILIRVFGGLPEGVMYAILLMNAAAPLIEKVTQPRPFGHRRQA